MSQTGYLILAICLIATLLVVFIVSFVLYVKTPAPKGCENVKINKENCASCNRAECKFYQGEGE